MYEYHLCLYIFIYILLVGRIRSVVSSLEKQARHNSIAGQAEPTARAATRRAKPFLSAAEYKNAMKIHDRANIAKHCWADALSDTVPEEMVGDSSKEASVEEQPPRCGDRTLRPEVEPLPPT